MTVNVLLAGRLSLYGPAAGHPINDDGTYQLSMSEGSTVSEVITQMRLPVEEIAISMRNGRVGGTGERLEPGYRVVLVHPNAAAMWRTVGTWNKGMESTLDFGRGMSRRKAVAAA